MTVVNEQAPKKRNWLLIGLGAAALFCLCAVVALVFVFYRVGKTVQDSVQTDPQTVKDAALEIVDAYELPPGYEGKMSMNVMVYSFVMFGPSETVDLRKPFFLLAQFEAGVSQEQMEQQLRQSIEQQMGQRGIKLELVEVKKAVIRGRETEIAVYEGVDEQGDPVRQEVTTFPGKNGSAMLLVMGDKREWDQKTVDAFIASIQ